MDEIPVQDEWYRQPLWNARIRVTMETPDPIDVSLGVLRRPDHVAHIDIQLDRPNGDVAALRGLSGYTVVYPREDRPSGLLIVGMAIDPERTMVSTEVDARDRWWTAEQAQEAGYKVDRTVYPWRAYQGPRFAPFSMRPVVTPAVLDDRDVIR